MVKVDDQLQVSEQRYRRLFETAQDEMLILDADTGKITAANPFLENLLEYSDTELVGHQLWEIGVFKDVIDSKKAFVVLQTKRGRAIDVEFISNVYTEGDKKVIQCNIRDITNRKKAEQAIEARTRELEELTRSQEETQKAMLNVMEDLEESKSIIEIEKVKDEAMLESIGDGLIAVDADRKILIVNKSAEKMLEWKHNEMVGRELTSLPLEDNEGHLLPLEQRPTYLALTTGETTNSVYVYVRRDKTKFPIAINVTPIKLGNKIIGALDVFRDITREQEIDRAKSEFVSLASHQLRTPLGIMKWYLEAIDNEDYFARAPEVIRRYYDEIYKSNERVLSLVRDLLSVSRIEQGRVKNVPKLVDPLQVIRDIVEQMKIAARKKEVTLSLTVENSEIPRVNIDILRLHEVIENLVGNAIEYTLAGGKVSVKVTSEADNLVIAIQDTGIGIAQEEQKKLFTKFFRSETAVGHNPEGSGLGLYVVKSYVEGWGGKVTVTSKIGVGSTFTVYLPVKGGDKNEKNISS